MRYLRHNLGRVAKALAAASPAIAGGTLKIEGLAALGGAGNEMGYTTGWANIRTNFCPGNHGGVMMRRRIRNTIAGGIAWAFILIAAPASAAHVDYFLKIPGVDGESTDSRHKGEIEILSFSWGATQSGPNGTVDARDFLVWQRHSRTTPLLAEALLTKKELTSATLVGELRTSKEPVPYLIIRMKPVYITSYQTGGSSGDVVPTDQISLNFEEIKYEYTRYDEATSRPLETFTGGFNRTTGVFLPD